jgi:hypothetical protein
MSDRKAWIERARAVPIEQVTERRGIKLTKRGKEQEGACPVCGGNDRFSINPEENVWNCRGCQKGGNPIDLEMHLNGGDFNAAVERLTGEPPPKGNGKDRGTKERKVVVAEYRYEDETGALVSVKERIEFQEPGGTFVLKEGKHDKKFRQKRPDPDNPGQWIWNVKGVSPIPYRLPELINAIGSEQTIYIVEGEKCADALWEIGVPATTNVGGACKWKQELNEHFKDADVVLVPDHDDTGFKHIHQVGESLKGVAKRIRVLVLPDLRPKGDVVDWLAAGGTREKFDELVAQAADWQSATDKLKEENAKVEADRGPQLLPPLLPPPTEPMAVARLFVDLHGLHEGVLTIRCWSGCWWMWRTSRGALGARAALPLHRDQILSR